MADIAKEIHENVKRITKESREKIKTIVFAALTLGATIACNDWMKYMFEKILGPNNNGWAKFFHAFVWLAALAALSVLSVKFFSETEETDAPKKEEEKDKDKGLAH